jgi:ribosomal protein L7/L12
VKLTSEQKQQLEHLIASGNKLEAIKQFRNMADVGLTEAKAFIDAMEAGKPLAAARETPSRSLKEAEQAALAALSENNPIEAIKRYRQHTHLGLKEAKEAVDVLSVVHRSNGRINPKVAQAVMEKVFAGRKDEALTLVMSSTGYDDAEAKALIKHIGGLRLSASSCAGGCLSRIIVFAALAGLVWYALKEGGLL